MAQASGQQGAGGAANTHLAAIRTTARSCPASFRCYCLRVPPKAAEVPAIEPWQSLPPWFHLSTHGWVSEWGQRHERLSNFGEVNLHWGMWLWNVTDVVTHSCRESRLWILDCLKWYWGEIYWSSVRHSYFWSPDSRAPNHYPYSSESCNEQRYRLTGLAGEISQQC